LGYITLDTPTAQLVLKMACTRPATFGLPEGGNVGWVGGASKQPSTMQETVITGYALAVGRARGGLGRGKITFGYIDSI
jgi:hypothetical protein